LSKHGFNEKGYPYNGENLCFPLENA